MIHSADVFAYLRKGLGIGLNTRFGFRVIKEVEAPAKDSNDKIVQIPLETEHKVDVCLVRSNEAHRWREMGPETETFLDALRAFYHKKRKESQELPAWNGMSDPSSQNGATNAHETPVRG